MSDKHPKPDAIVPNGVHGQHRADNDEYVPRSVWAPRVVRRLADYIKQLRKVDDESNKRVVARQPPQPAHVCARNPHRTCNCPAGACADDDATYRYARGPFGAVLYDELGRVRAPRPNQLGNFRCPITGQLCSSTVCREWCESGVDYTKT